MSQIKKGDYVIAHLDGTFRGKVVEVVREQTVTWSAQGPMSPESFCLVELADGSVVKKKSTDLYIDYK
tara:strand:+ start:1380 stop:1583 length:204 start_codon:yes stop_codon:yes gene_type:complete